MRKYKNSIWILVNPRNRTENGIFREPSWSMISEELKKVYWLKKVLLNKQRTDLKVFKTNYKRLKIPTEKCK